MKVKGNQKLFDAWMTLCIQLTQESCIVQNDMEISEEDVKEWNNNVDFLLRTLSNLQEQILNYVTQKENNK
jgi:hypothetical protein